MWGRQIPNKSLRIGAAHNLGLPEVPAYLLSLKECKAVEERPFSDISYQQFLNEEKLMGSRCQKCGALFAPPRPICIKCHGMGMQWVEMKGRGQLVAFACIAIGHPLMIKEGYDRNHPYISGVVELEEGVKVDARIEEVDGTKPEAIKIGTPLIVKFLHRGEGERLKTFLAFKPL